MLNKQGPKKIDWCNFSWNPISGCLHDCSYCYLKKMSERFKLDMMKPRFRQENLDDLRKLERIVNINRQKIFVGSSGDMWGDWVDWKDIIEVLEICEENPKHIFQFLTKNPEMYNNFDCIENGWYGTTDDGTTRCEFNVENLIDYTPKAKIRFVSYEPLLFEPESQYALDGIHWIIIGADSSKGACAPPYKWANNLIVSARERGIAVWIKDNYGYLDKIKEFPE